MATKNFKDFCPGSLFEGRAEVLQILVGIFGETMDYFIHDGLF